MKLSQRKENVRQICILVARVAKIMDSLLKDTCMILCAVTAEVTALDNRKKISKRHRVFLARGQSWNKNSQKRKSEKYSRFKHELKWLFFLIFYAHQRGWNVRENQKWSKQSYLTTSREDTRETYRSGVLCYWPTVLTSILLNRPLMS